MLYEGSSESQLASLPSFLQWTKGPGKTQEGQCKIITTIWFPNKFPNFTFDTECFRLRVPSTDEMALEFTNSLEEVIEKEQVLVVYLVSQKLAKFRIEVLQTELADWDPIGTHGYRCSVRNKKSKR